VVADTVSYSVIDWLILVNWMPF